MHLIRRIVWSLFLLCGELAVWGLVFVLLAPLWILLLVPRQPPAPVWRGRW